HSSQDFLALELKETMPILLKEELHLTLKEIDYQASEEAVCETILYPILREAWKKYRTFFSLSSHKAIELNEDLKGAPDYLISKKSDLGRTVLDTPYLAVIEAKSDNFSKAWGQCLIEMYTIQQLNATPELPVFGIISNGETWKFGKLVNNQFIENETFYDLSNLDDLFSALINLLENCKQVYIK
ncbi:MAG: hypothetical protein ACKVTZ_10930, partial [Bacteroidia bacterium]